MIEAINVWSTPSWERERYALTCTAPEDLRAFLAWEDAWRAALLDLAVRTSNRNPQAFAVAAAVVYAGALTGYYQ